MGKQRRDIGLKRTEGGAVPSAREQTKDGVLNVLRNTFDPEIPVNVLDLGLIYEVTLGDAGEVEVVMTLTTPSCPAAGSLPGEIERRLREVPGVSAARVEVVWEPPWTRERMSEAALLELGLL